MGLRVSEVVALKLNHIDSHRMVVLIQGAKGKKDRLVPFPVSLLPKLKIYNKEYKPKKFVV